MSKRWTVLYTGGELTETEAQLLRTNDLDVVARPPNLSEADLIRELAGKQALILAGFETVTAEVLSAVNDLRVVAFFGVGYHAFVDVEVATARGVAVTNAPGANARAVAEFTIGLIIDGVRRISHLAFETRMGRWPEHRSSNLEALTLGIVGMGTIARKVATIARRGLDMRVRYWNRTRYPAIEHELELDYAPTIEQLMDDVDVVSLHIALTSETRGMLNDARLSRLGPGAILVNTSEAELIEPQALHDSIREGRVATVLMDGYYEDPAPAPDADRHGFLSLPSDRFLLTPHTANATAESSAAMLAANVLSIVNIRDTGDDAKIVNPSFREASGRSSPR